MRFNARLGALAAAVGALAVAVPAAAHPGAPNHPGGGRHPWGSHKCKAHKVAYTESGVVDSATPSTLAQNPDGTWSGTLVVDVTRTNHWAKADKGTTVTYTFTNANLRVRFDDGTTGFAAGERVRLLGKLQAVGKNCAPLSPAPSPQFRRVVVHAATSYVDPLGH